MTQYYPEKKQGLIKQILSDKPALEFQEGVGAPHLVSAPIYGISFGLFKNFGENDALNFCLSTYQREGSQTQFILDANTTEHRHLLHDDTIDRLYQTWQPYRRKFLQLVSINKLKNVSLADYKKYYEIYFNGYSVPLITEWFTAFLSDETTSRILTDHPGAKNEIAELTKPPELTFFNQEELELLRLTLRHNLDRTTMLEHQKKWFWIYGNYRDTEELPVSLFEKRIREFWKLPPSEIQNKINHLRTYSLRHAEKIREIRRRSTLTKEDIVILVKIGFVGLMQDERKEINLKGNWMLNQFLQKASDEFGWDFRLLQFTTPKEFSEMLETKKFPEKMLKERLSACIQMVNKDGYEEVYGGKTARALIDQVNILRVISSGNKIRGISASPGLVHGRVRIVTDPAKEGRDFKKGEILVTSMTRPDMVPIMHLAIAIVTNEGGLTSHAAIVARELKIPCIVGTKVATQVFKDGDLVEVDATVGVIRKVNQ